MFDWFKGKTAKEYLDNASNVVNFPKPESVPYIEPPKEPEKPAQTYYRLGLTSDNRVSFNMGYSEITMNAAGINNMIKQLECFRDMLESKDEE